MSGTSRRTMMGINSDIWSICTGTDSTMSNMTGPGRLVGNFISRGGRRIEAFAGYVAHKLGSGPYAVLARILIPTLCPYHASDHYDRAPPVHGGFRYFCEHPSQKILIIYLGCFCCSRCRDCFVEALILRPLSAAHTRELLQFTRSRDIAIQRISIQVIYLLICFHHALREYLSHLAILALNLVTKDPFTPVGIREAALYVLRLLEDDCFYQELRDVQTSLLEPMPNMWRDDTTSVTLAQIMKLLTAHRAVLGFQPHAGVNVAVILQHVTLKFRRSLAPPKSFPPRHIIMMSIVSCYTGPPDSPEFWCLKFLMQYWEESMKAGKADTMDWRAIAADLYIPVLQHRINSTSISFLPLCFVFPQIPPAVKEMLITQGNTLGVKKRKGGDELAGLIKGVISSYGILPPRLVDWLQRVIDAFETPWLPEDSVPAPVLVHEGGADGRPGRGVDAAVEEEFTGVKRRGGRRLLKNASRMETIMEEEDMENGEGMVL